MTGPFGGHAVLYYAVVVGMLVVALVCLFTGKPIDGVG